ncbi:MAG TPA: hypothetical protein VKV03_11390 [Candidatus Binataceae bacterium]|nr:hypothetical protein [Candidatus Binataceae bacterium]
MAPETNRPAVTKDDWVTPPEQNIPQPTYAPAGLALGVAFVLFGIVTSYLFCAAGAVMMAIALKSWIGGMADGE